MQVNQKFIALLLSQKNDQVIALFFREQIDCSRTVKRNCVTKILEIFSLISITIEEIVKKKKKKLQKKISHYYFLL